MRSSWNPATGRHLLLTARRHHRQIVGSDVNTDSNEHGDQAEPESPIMMCAPPVRGLAMAMMTFAVRAQVFGIVHGYARLQIKSKKLGGVPSVQAKITSLFPGGVCRDLNAAQR